MRFTIALLLSLLLLSSACKEYDKLGLFEIDRDDSARPGVLEGVWGADGVYSMRDFFSLEQRLEFRGDVLKWSARCNFSSPEEKVMFASTTTKISVEEKQFKVIESKSDKTHYKNMVCFYKEKSFHIRRIALLKMSIQFVVSSE